ncbi:hypothetical protein KCU65_g3134, partial [Aureobasidium melanogenum]
MSADQPQQQFAGRNDNMQAAALVPAAITMTLSLLLYGIRIQARRSSPSVWTDGMITAALILAISDLVLIAMSCQYGLGRHTVFVDSVRVVKARHFGFLAQPLFVQCQPTSALWNDDLAAQCWPPERTQLAAYVTLGFGVITSLLLSLTPLTFVKGMNRPLHELAALGLLVGIGLFVTMSSVANMVYLHGYRITQDPLRDMIAPTAWWQIEQNFCIIASIAIHLRTPYETLLARFGLIYQVRTDSSTSYRLNRLEDGSQMLKSLKTTIPWGSVHDSAAHLPSIVKTTEVVHSTELLRSDEFQFGSPARRPSWQ